MRDFLPLDYSSRLARYAMINQCMPRFYNLDRPVIGAINSHAVGVGLVLARFCDIRVAWRDAFFACPEIDRGVLAGGGAFLSRIGVPRGRIREMIYTGARFMADQLQVHRDLQLHRGEGPGAAEVDGASRGHRRQEPRRR